MKTRAWTKTPCLCFKQSEDKMSKGIYDRSKMKKKGSYQTRFRPPKEPKKCKEKLDFSIRPLGSLPDLEKSLEMYGDSYDNSLVGEVIREVAKDPHYWGDLARKKQS
jgi:hypothetical protein